VGFADYFTPDFLEDHWVCEYHDGSAWRLLDAELSDAARRQFKIDFPTHDVPRDRFVSAGGAWIAARQGRLDPVRMGVSRVGVSGLWFAAASLLRDAAALTVQELLDWDYWGPARDFGPRTSISPSWMGRFDLLAADLAGEPVTLDQARRLVQDHPWAKPGASVLSYVDGRLKEVVVG